MQEDILITWDTLYPRLVAFVYTKIKDKPAAEDIVQDVFIKVHTKSHQVKEGYKVSGWIYQITRNAIADHFRMSAKNLEPANIDWESNTQEFNDCVAVCLNALMKTLPEKYRIALEMTELDSLSQHQLAERLKISYPGARSRVQRARKMLREMLDRMYRIETDSYGNIILCENRIPCRCSQSCNDASIFE
jgi:RNA polymerase sigma-70 factor, ECF subfamily